MSPYRPPKAQIPRVPGARVSKPRPSPQQLGYGAEWKKARAAFLAAHPRCECTEHLGRADAPMANTVDHRIAHKGDRELFWNRRNWVAMAASCHSRKTATEDGGFGNRRRPPGSRPL